MYFRINTLKINESDLVNRFSQNIKFDVPKYFFNKYVYWTDVEIGKTFEHALGLIYVQSLSSTLPALILNPNENELVLDLCSAPGSKTTLMAELMNNKGLILANEISLERIKMLASNFDRMGVLNSAISNFDGTLLWKYFHNEFDKILIDPPCSALGSLQDNSKSMHERNLKRIKHLVEIQLKLLTSSAKMLKPEGEIVYSTCTTTVEENEGIIDKFLEKHPFEVIEIANQNIFESNYLGEKISKELSKTVRIESDKFNSEAFFIAKLKKIDGQQNKKIINKFNIPQKVFNEFDDAVIISILNGLCEKYGIENIFWKDFLFHKKETDIYFITKSNFDFSKIPFHRIGLKLASLDSKTGWRISTNAAQILYKQISKNILTLENKRDLISYFMGQKTKVDHQNSDFVVVKFEGLMIGSGKVRDGILFSYFPRGRRMNEVDFNLLKE